MIFIKNSVKGSGFWVSKTFFGIVITALSTLAWKVCKMAFTERSQFIVGSIAIVSAVFSIIGLLVISVHRALHEIAIAAANKFPTVTKKTDESEAQT